MIMRKGFCRGGVFLPSQKAVDDKEIFLDFQGIYDKMVQ